MSKIMDKVAVQKKQEVCTKLQEAFDNLQEGVEAFNDIVNAAWSNLQLGPLNAYNEAISNANEWQSGIVEEIQEYIDSKSEKWQEGDKGQAFVSWKEQYEEELETVELEKPDEVTFDNDNPSELLDQKPEEPD